MANGIISKAKENIVAKDAKSARTLKDWVEVYKPEISKALPSAITPERFARLTTTALSSNPRLQQCTPKSFIGAMLQAAQVGLEPNTVLQQAFLIPRKNAKTGNYETVFELGYHGMIDLAYRGGVIEINAEAVYEHDEFEYSLGMDRTLKHKPALKDRGEPICVYATWKSKDGGSGFAVMSIEDVRKHAAQYSESYKSGYSSPWKSDFLSMAKKTVLKQALKYAPMNVEFQRQIAADETVKSTIDADMMDVPDESIETAFADEDVNPETGEITPKEEKTNA